jgi:DNA-binding NarL/FixJ family response regulator
MPEVKIVMLTASDEDEHFRQAVQLGVHGYLLKDLDANELFDLIEGLDRGEAALTRTMAARLLKNMANRSVQETSGEEPLTEREMEVLRILAQGASNPEIGRALNITVNTVKSHISHILAKLQLENRTQAAAYAVEKRIADKL